MTKTRIADGTRHDPGMGRPLPVSAVIPTRHRSAALTATLQSLSRQSAQPTEIVVVDASDDESTGRACREVFSGLCSEVRWLRAIGRGAAVQRNQGVAVCTQPVVAFFDDDILFEPECVARLWSALVADPRLGAVNATITNQMFSHPGRVTSALYPLLSGRRLSTYAGRVLGPGVNLLPEDRDDLPDVVPVEWLNTTCTLYRRDVLPDPPFPSFFTGYSLCEDLTLSLTVARQGSRLANARTARIFHDSQPGDHKRNHTRLSAMELVNRHFVMTSVLGRRGILDYARLALWEGFQVAAAARAGPRRLLSEIGGKVLGSLQIFAGAFG